MIRIDEIYSGVFWTWLRKNRPGLRLFFCDPPGNTEPTALFNLGRDDIEETGYVFMHDQEPVDRDLYKKLFNEVALRNKDITHPPAQGGVFNGRRGHVIVSERGQFVEQAAQRYLWHTHYYFYHGWACLDWFRGYDRTWLIPRARDRRPTKTFMSPNRIVGGQRDHRVLFLYHLFLRDLGHNHISAPKICPYENVDIDQVAMRYCNTYPDIQQVLAQANLPRTFQGEHTQQMTSCWLGNFAEAQDSMFYVPTETVYWGQRLHVTEKTFKAIALEMPFILVAPAGTLAYLREYGFQTFGNVIDESYDLETDDHRRLAMVTDLLKHIDSMTNTQRHELWMSCLPMVEHNWRHFYQGGFENLLWQELESMLNGI